MECHTRRHWKEPLFELRVKSKEGIARVFFCTKIGKKIVMLHSFVKKSQKIPRSELKIAKTRMSEVMENVTF
nr:type II toxin-antitoxin system RelE/ParE family toxin [Desulfobulbaceae bacterium]